jgi:2-polyprenyl-3-methyl-5-hydroxy-6-metoxy-1,4-benzoquinol methylase
MLLGRAAGVTAIIDRLLEFKTPDIPGTIIWPAYEQDLFRAQPAESRLREQLKIPGDHFVVVYPGNVHAANAREMRSLYLAIGAVNRRGLPVTLVRLGQGYIDFLGPELAHLHAHTVNVGQVPHLEVPRYLALADVLIQPGRADPFNDYRFPSKLPEFFGMGRPIILPKSNIGHQVRDGEDALLLHEGSAIEIAQNLEMLLRDSEMRQRLGDNARAFAEENFDWCKSAKKLEAFYLAHSNRRHRTIGSVALEQIATRYQSFAPATLSYATVEDYSDSQQHLPQLAGLQKDLKDVQRPWTLKTILGRVPRGGRLLEIGGGDPYVASILATLGYEVWIIDPYEGLGNGPLEFDAIKTQTPQVKFIRGWFPDALAELDDPLFDCIYSISVLEHVPGDLIESVAAATPPHLRDNGWNIHAVDHVTLGWGAEDHRRRLGMIVRSFGFSEAELDKLLTEMESDPDTYFLSADGHNLWRGARAYRDFPMRRCVSIQFCRQALRPPAS